MALTQLLARDPEFAHRDEASGDTVLLRMPHAHGAHLHIGQFAVSTREASGFSNRAVWTALARKGLARADGPVGITLTAEGMSYDTGLGERFLTPLDY